MANTIFVDHEILISSAVRCHNLAHVHICIINAKRHSINDGLTFIFQIAKVFVTDFTNWVRLAIILQYIAHL